MFSDTARKLSACVPAASIIKLANEVRSAMKYQFLKLDVNVGHCSFSTATCNVWRMYFYHYWNSNNKQFAQLALILCRSRYSGGKTRTCQHMIDLDSLLEADNAVLSNLSLTWRETMEFTSQGQKCIQVSSPDDVILLWLLVSCRSERTVWNPPPQRLILNILMSVWVYLAALKGCTALLNLVTYTEAEGRPVLNRFLFCMRKGKGFSET